MTTRTYEEWERLSYMAGWPLGAAWAGALADYENREEAREDELAEVTERADDAERKLEAFEDAWETLAAQLTVEGRARCRGDANLGQHCRARQL
jgi:hypothetical protein